jgi:nucleotide-binding universal stress UspA family protein
MAKPRPILVPVDGSAGSLRALALACERSRDRDGAQVIALNVQTPMPPSRFAPAVDIREHHQRMAQEVFARVAKAAKRQRTEVTQRMVIGMPAEMILREAVRSRASEIIMGTRGLGRLGGLLLGSVATKVVQLAKVPVTLVK